MEATAVIGANFGDEGKGLLVDYLSDSHSVVIRYNGGAQAGHTVVTPEGQRHVFHHVGAGALRGSTTYLSKYFILNPIYFMKEMLELETNFGIRPNVVIDPECRITTPADMLLGQLREKKLQHGSCGMGINETIERSCLAEYDLRIGFTIDNQLKEKEDILFGRAAQERARELQVDISPFSMEKMKEDFLKAYYWMRNHSLVGTIGPKSFRQNSRIIFEGAQGLLLDEYSEYFPHVTRSRTGLNNVVKLCNEMHVDRINAIYVTRTYLTRHGNGPLPGEDPAMKYPDDTNLPNQWQGSLRFAPLNHLSLYNRIRYDLRSIYHNQASWGMKIIPQLALTHCDQIPNVEYEYNQFIPCKYRSFGPTREDVATHSPLVVQ